MNKGILTFVLYFVVCVSFASEQYSEGTCILLKNQVREYSAYPQSNQYKTAKRSVDRHCVNPVTLPKANQTNTIATSTEKLTPIYTTKKLHSQNLTESANQAVVTKPHQAKTSSPANNMLSLVLKIGALVLVIMFVLAVVKAIILMFAKRAAKSLLNKVSGRIEPVVSKLPIRKEEREVIHLKRDAIKLNTDTNVSDKSSSVLKDTIAEIVANDANSSSGLQGEAIVNNLIEKVITNKVLSAMSNVSHYTSVLLTNDNDELTEIDHLIVSPVGVFVIESKNYSGYIFGSQHQAKWTQTLTGRKTQFMNPLRQNYKHCLAVSRLLGVVDGVESLVLFHDKASFKTKLPPNVRYVSEMEAFLSGFTHVKFTDSQLEEFNTRLTKVISVTTSEDFKQHINEVKAKQCDI